MLAFLRVKGFAIIDELDVEFKEGFNVITGETGAGKSIIINALASLLNARVPTDVVRGAAKRAEVVGHCFQDGEEYILRRIIGSQGRSRAFINDNPVTVKSLEELGGGLIHVYGQNESQQLLGKEHYVSMVDRFLHLEEERQALSERVRRLDEVSRLLEAKKSVAAGQSKEIDLLTYQLQEIERERIGTGEEERVRERLKVLKDAARIKSSIEGVVRGLYEDEQSAHSLVTGCSALLRPFSGIVWVDALRKRMEGISFEAEDIVRSLREEEKSLDYEPGELEGLGERLETITRLKEKYGKTYGGIAEFEDWARKRLEELLHMKTDAEELELEKASCEAAVSEMAGGLSARRRSGAREIEELVRGELAFLSMKGVQFKV
jgi:DNA repair protein RecN (Recombination protein N)